MTFPATAAKCRRRGDGRGWRGAVEVGFVLFFFLRTTGRARPEECCRKPTSVWA